MKKNYRRKKVSKIRNIIIDYVANNSKTYLILVIIFLIGVMLGIVFINNVKEAQSNQISVYINNFINSIKENYQISKTELLKTSILNNLIIAIVLWFLGCTVIGVPLMYLVICYKGYCVGYTISAVIATIGTGKGLLFLISTMLLQNIICIPAILTLAVSGIKLYKIIMEDKRKEIIKVQILKHTLFSIFIFIILMVSSLIEVYVSGNLTTILLKYC